jgi:hypothetical protein
MRGYPPYRPFLILQRYDQSRSWTYLFQHEFGDIADKVPRHQEARQQVAFAPSLKISVPCKSPETGLFTYFYLAKRYQNWQCADALPECINSSEQEIV